MEKSDSQGEEEELERRTNRLRHLEYDAGQTVTILKSSLEEKSDSYSSDIETEERRERFRRLREGSSDDKGIIVEQCNEKVEVFSKESNDVSVRERDDFVPGKMVNMAFSPHKLMKVKVNIEGHSFAAILDSGADHSLISSEVVSKLGLNVQKSKETFDALGQSMIGCVGKITTSMNIGKLGEIDMNFTVFSSEINSKIAILLGVDFMRDNNLEIDVKSRMLIKHFKEGGRMEMYLDAEGEVTTRMICNVPCYAEKDVELLSNHVHRVRINVPALPQAGNDILVYDDHNVSKSLEEKVRGLSGISDLNSKYVYMVSTEGNVNVKVGDQIGVINSVLTTDVVSDNIDDGASGSWEDEVDLSHLESEQKKDIYNILSKYRQVFSANDSDIGLASVTSHKIRLTDETPIYQRPRRVPQPISEELERQCRELCDADIIEPSTSAWSSPIVPVMKKDETIRMCIDYRKLNKVTVPDKFPIPNLLDSIYGLKGTKFFTKLDLVRGYYQLPVDEKSRPYTAFSTNRNHWQFKRLSFGLRNAPSAFQREIQAVLQTFPSNKVIAYLDDILIMGQTFSEHMDLVSKVLQTLLTYGIKIKVSKCEWVRSEVEYLGHIVSESGVKKTPEYLEKVLNYPRPRTIRELREFLGLVNFQRKFVPQCSSIQKPLSANTSGNKNKLLVWDDDMVASFETLKREMATEIELGYPDYSDNASKLELYVDASDIGAGAYLAQIQGSEHKIIGFASMTFSGAQLNYATLQRELVALRWGVKTFRPFLQGVEFILFTDHQPLVHLDNMKLVCSRLARTMEELAEYLFEIRYLPGHLNTAADALSRLSNELPWPEVLADSDVLPEGLKFDGPPSPGGGDSLFISLFTALTSFGICSLPGSVDELRRLLVADLLDHPGTYNIKLERDSRRKLRAMMEPGHLPCMDVILAASRQFNTRVLVYFWPTQPVIYQFGPTYNRTIHIQCRGGVHFNALVEIFNYRAPDPRQCAVYTVCPIVKHVNNCVSEVDDLDETMLEIDIHKDDDSVLCSHVCGNQPVVHVSVDCLKACALLDTGAEISLVSQGFLDRVANCIEVQVEEEQSVDIVGFSGHRRAVSRVAWLRFSIGSYTMDKSHKFAIVEDNIMPFCVLLGVDFLGAFDISVDFYNMVCRNKFEILASLEVSNLDGLNFCMLASNQPTHSHNVKFSCVGNDLRFEILGNSTNVTGLSMLREGGAIEVLQARNSVLKVLKRVITLNIPAQEWPTKISSFKRYVKELRVVDGVVVYGERRVIVVPFHVVTELAISIHFHFSHVGRDKLSGLLSELVWYPSQYKIVNDLCTSCHMCQIMKVNNLRIYPPTVKITSSYPFELVAADCISFVQSRSGYIGCLVVVDHFSKFVVAVPIKNKQSSTIVGAFQRNILPFLPAVPTSLLTDNGPEFASSEFSGFLSRWNIKQKLTTPNHPSSNGAVERVNRTIQNLLKVMIEEHHEWDCSVARAIVNYNNSPHAELGMSPSKFLLTRSHQIDNDPSIDLGLQETWRIGHPNFVPFKVNDCVLMVEQHKGHLSVNKFLPKYSGPHRVIKVNGDGLTYVISDISRGKNVRAHYTQLRYYKNPPNYLLRSSLYKELSKHTGDEVEHQLDIDAFEDINMSTSEDDVGLNDPSSSDSDGSESIDSDSLESIDSGSLESIYSLLHANNDISLPTASTGVCRGCIFESNLEECVSKSNEQLICYPTAASPPQEVDNLYDQSFVDIIPELVESNVASDNVDVASKLPEMVESAISFNNLYRLTSVESDLLDWQVSSDESSCLSSIQSNYEPALEMLESGLEENLENTDGDDGSFEGFACNNLLNKDAGEAMRSCKNMQPAHSTPEHPEETASCQKNDNVRAVGMHTRSKGPVVELSNVQEKTLEFSRKKRSHN